MANAFPLAQRAKQFVLALGAVTTLFGCSTDLDINAPYKDITVVYGLLNMRDSIHYVKINKAYLGSGDAFLYAQIPDSNEWGDGAISSAKVIRRMNGSAVDEFQLRDTILTGRAPGVFYSPDQRFYYFRENFSTTVIQNGVPVTLHLDQNSDYDLELVVKGQTITATTTIVNDFSFSAPDQSLDVKVNMMSGNGFGAYELNWTSNRDGKRYEAKYRFNYKEVRGSDTTELKQFTQRVNSVVAASSSNFEPMAVVIEGELFFNTVAQQIPNDPTVNKRIFLGVDFLLSVANDEFHTFLTLSEPVSGIIEDRPSYTNISNGYGLFAGRYTKDIIGKRLDSPSLAQLVEGNITAHLRFCSGMPGDQNGPHGCP